MRARAQESHGQAVALERQVAAVEEQLDAGRTYSSETAFRNALNTRIRAIAKATDIEPLDVARRFALQQFVSRLFDGDPDSPWLMTGGTSLQFRTPEARSTTDLDLAMTGTIKDLTAALTDATQRRAGEHGTFAISVKAADRPGSYSGKITYMLNGARFATAKLDVVVGRQFPFDHDTLEPEPIVVIDDVRPMPPVPTYAVVSHVGDKVAAMYELHGGDGATPSTRAHDLADIVVLSRCATADAEELRQAVRGEEARRGVSVPSPLVLPDEQWRRTYAAKAATSGLPLHLLDADTALAAAERFVGPVLSGRVQAGTWDPLLGEWRPKA